MSQILKTAEVKWLGREEARLQLTLDDSGTILAAKLAGIGGPVFLQALKEYRASLKGKISDLPLPGGVASQAILLRELILKIKDQWKFPFSEVELCHCRGVLTERVDQAVCAGAHTTQKVSELTSASTACGTCRPDVDAIIKYRLQG